MAERPVTMTLPEFRRFSGIAQRTAYELIDAGQLESIKLGSRRLIVVESYLRLVERLRNGGINGGTRRGRKPKLLYLRDVSSGS